MAISQILESMWLDIWGNSLISAIAILATFAYLCFKRKLGLAETFIVIFPVVIGVSTVGCFGNATTGCIPNYISGTIVMSIGALWGLALTKAFNTWEPYVRVYAIFVCMNMALIMYGYPMGDINLTTTAASLNLISDSSTVQGTGWELGINTIYFIMDMISLSLNFMLGGAIPGVFKVSGLPTTIVTFITVPIQLISFIIALPFLAVVYNMITAIISATIGGITKLLRL